MKHISTLVKDIEDVVTGKGGWDKTVTEYLTVNIGEAAEKRLIPSNQQRTKTLRMSNIGSPCTRKLWYYLNTKGEEQDLSASTHMKFFFGDILETLLLSLAKAAGHEVTGEQDEVVVNGIVGHRDAVIDGVTIDVKSASSLGFKKFEKNGLRLEDPFGYIQQLTGYVKAAASDPLVTDKTGGAFLAIDKQFGSIVLDYYDLSPELTLFDKRLAKVQREVSAPSEPARGFEPVAEGKSGNMKLPSACSYCDYKFKCHSGLRGFAYSNGPMYLTKVLKLPLVPEFKK